MMSDVKICIFSLLVIIDSEVSAYDSKLKLMPTVYGIFVK